MERIDSIVNKIVSAVTEIQKILKENRIAERVEKLRFVSKVLSTAEQGVDLQQNQIDLETYRILYGGIPAKKKKAPTQEKIARLLILHPEGMSVEDLYHHAQCYKLSKGAIRIALFRMREKGIVRLENDRVILQV